MLDESTLRIARYAYDRWSKPGLTISIGTFAVWSLGSLEGYLQLPNLRFAARYGTYNILPSLIWGTQSPNSVLETCGTLRHLKFKPPPSRHALWIKILCSLRGAIAGSIVLSNVVALTSLWQKAQDDYRENIRLGREPPMISGPTVIRLAGEKSSTTMLSMQREQIWPVFESTSPMESTIGGRDKPVYWQVNNGEYSKPASWDDMHIDEGWLFETPTKRLLYLEADATSGDESALALYADTARWFEKIDYRSELDDLDLKEVGQGFRRLARSGDFKDILRVLLVDCTVKLTSGGGRHTSVRDRVEELELADIIIDSRAAVLHAILSWLETQNCNCVILETPSKAWFQSIQAELKKHGYKVIDQGVAPEKNDYPMLVYERSSADTMHTITQYLERGIVKTDRVCALLTSHDGLDEVKSSKIAHICSSDIYDRMFRWVKAQALNDKPIQEIQAMLDSGKAYETFAKP